MDRRRALGLFVNSVGALIAGGLSTILGAFAVRPRVSARDRWVRAGAVTDLTANQPVPRVLSFPTQDGWYREQARRTVFVVWDGKSGVHALSATCTHLGCQVQWTAVDRRFRCPCHGGVFDADGRVLAGPPPRPLDRVDARLDPSTGAVLVRL